jgi:hypothetical protein
MNPEPYQLCPRFDHCSVNSCPLDPIQRGTHPQDKERKCTIEKQVRLRISKSFPGLLPKDGLTAAEWSGKQSYERKPLAVKINMAQMGKDALSRHRASQ